MPLMVVLVFKLPDFKKSLSETLHLRDDTPK